jgi:hypothetical protein
MSSVPLSSKIQSQGAMFELTMPDGKVLYAQDATHGAPALAANYIANLATTVFNGQRDGRDLSQVTISKPQVVSTPYLYEVLISEDGKVQHVTVKENKPCTPQELQERRLRLVEQLREVEQEMQKAAAAPNYIVSLDKISLSDLGRQSTGY